MKAKLILAIAVSLLIAEGACSPKVASVDFCQVLNNRESFEGRKFKTDIVVYQDYHGRVAGSLECHGLAIGVIASDADQVPELRELESAIENAYKMHNPFGASKSRPQGVVVHVVARVQRHQTMHSEFVLNLVSASNWQQVDLPEQFFGPPTSPRFQ